MYQTENELSDVDLSEHCTILLGALGGKYPDANGMTVHGSDRTALIDPALRVAARKDSMPNVDFVFLSHCHDDHFAGLGDYPNEQCWVHQSEQACLRSLDDLLGMFGVKGECREETPRGCLEKFNYVPRPDALAFTGPHRQRYEAHAGR